MRTPRHTHASAKLLRCCRSIEGQHLKRIPVSLRKSPPLGILVMPVQHRLLSLSPPRESRPPPRLSREAAVAPHPRSQRCQPRSSGAQKRTLDAQDFKTRGSLPKRRGSRRSANSWRSLLDILHFDLAHDFEHFLPCQICYPRPTVASLACVPVMVIERPQDSLTELSLKSLILRTLAEQWTLRRRASALS